MLNTLKDTTRIEIKTSSPMAPEMTERCLLPEFQTLWYESLSKSTASADGGTAGSLF